MKLFYVPGTCSLSPHIVLRETGLPFELDLVDRATKRTQGGVDYKALNPKGYVPGLQLDDGKVLTEGAVIVQYLADRKPEKHLIPPGGTIERYRLQEWLNFIATEVHKGFSPLFNPKLSDEARKPIVDRLRDRLGLVARALDGRDYLMGEIFTVADAYLYTVLRWHARLKVDLGEWPVLERYMARVASRPAVQAALAAEGL